MKLSEALHTVAKLYVPGVVAFYGNVKPDPWMAAHESLAANFRDPHFCLLFVETCTQLIESFKRINGKPTKPTLVDAFHIGDENRLAEITSRFDRCCYLCESKQNIKIITSPTNELEAVIICAVCAKKNNNR